MIEFVILLPLFLFALLFFIWMGVTLNAKASLYAAVANATRLAATRGRGDVYGDVQGGRRVGAIPVLDDSHLAGSSQLSGREELLTNDLTTQFQPYDQAVNTVISAALPGADKLFEIPYPEYSYAIVYAVQSMRMSVGSSLRYPCDPEAANETGKTDGCLICRPINPDTIRLESFTGDPMVLRERLAIECVYRPSNFILSPLLRMLSMISGGTMGNGEGFGLIRARTLSDRTNDCRFVNSGNDVLTCCNDIRAGFNPLVGNFESCFDDSGVGP